MGKGHEGQARCRLCNPRGRSRPLNPDGSPIKTSWASLGPSPNLSPSSPPSSVLQPHRDPSIKVPSARPHPLHLTVKA